MENVIDFGVISRGSRLGDMLVLYPMQGKRRIIRLNRTKFEFTSTTNFSSEQDGINIMLPEIRELDFCFELKLVGKNEQDSRYCLTAQKNIPFRINGTVSTCAFVERGDTVDLGHARLEFKDKIDVEKDEELDQETELLNNERLIKSKISILIEGETGTGKSRLAKQIHDASERNGPLVHINLSSFAESLIESELFGHVKGAFTGAVGSKRGAFMDANRGTLFLDEIDSLPLHLQTKLLLFFDSNEVRAVGGAYSEKTDVRIIVASGKKLADLVANGKMRQDFYYRLTSGIVLQLSPLRERPELIRKMCKNFAEHNQVVIGHQLITEYQKLAWPGNVRQLLGHLDRKLALSKKRVWDFDALDNELATHKNTMDFAAQMNSVMTIEELRCLYAYKIWQRMNQSVDKTSKLLDITPNTLRSMLRKRDQMLKSA